MKRRPMLATLLLLLPTLILQPATGKALPHSQSPDGPVVGLIDEAQ